MGDFADVVLMPGDPLRAKHIAETFLEDVREVNNVRGMLGFTGTYKGRKISVMGHGMGIPSCSIYTKELITDFGVKKIIRVGSCGAVREDVKLRDVVIGMGACTDSKVNRLRFKDHDFAAIADFGMVRNAVDAAKALGVDARRQHLLRRPVLYAGPVHVRRDGKYGILGVEMEAAGIYGVAAEFGAKALTICTVSDHIRTHEQTTAAERQTTFNDMIKIALESVLLGDKERLLCRVAASSDPAYGFVPAKRSGLYQRTAPAIHADSSFSSASCSGKSPTSASHCCCNTSARY
ncbi:purine-nucleoside phosphorylase [Klebsiella pneumoniae]|uniref:Purine nucleoside phosphorylase DeoD-type n=8 Tax=Bacteria TaxID=2 RepID=A0A939NT48_KLEPN|nr:purine-nucleoside phosphorylase [Klebsiella pneumoniae]